MKLLKSILSLLLIANLSACTGLYLYNTSGQATDTCATEDEDCQSE